MKIKADKLKGTFLGEDIRKKIASFIDHTLLSPDATQDEIKKLCEEAKVNCSFRSLPQKNEQCLIY